MHTGQQLARGLADEVPIAEWKARISPFEAEMDERDVYVSAKAACLEMIKSGTTGFMEACAHPAYLEATVAAIEVSGLRANLTRSTMDVEQPYSPVPPPLRMSAAQNLAETRRMIARWHGVAGGRISAWCGWRHIYDVSAPLLVDLARLAREHGVGLHGHLSAGHEGGNTLDMLQVVRLAATVHKEVRRDATVITATQALRMGTLEGARACLWDDVGMLAPARKRTSS